MVEIITSVFAIFGIIVAIMILYGIGCLIIEGFKDSKERKIRKLDKERRISDNILKLPSSIKDIEAALKNLNDNKDLVAVKDVLMILSDNLEKLNATVNKALAAESQISSTKPPVGELP